MTLPFGRTSFPEIYEKSLVRSLFRPWAEQLLEEAGPARGERVLDIACGTGIVARLARERLGDGAKVVGVDVAPPMIAMARSVAPQVDWRVGDAAALPLQDGEQFDLVLCQQGLQFFPDRAAAAREMRRALAPNGRLAVSTWRPDEDFPVLLALRRIAERHLGPIADRRHAFGEPGALEALLREAGLRDVRSKTVSRKIRFEDGAVFVRLNALALIGMSEAGAKIGDEERERLLARIGEDSAGVLRANTDGNGFRYEIAAVVAWARA
jgi:ubiquinone/menaquinone biosynthesis C-methylase UbiE